jgi:hypothetical protein
VFYCPWSLTSGNKTLWFYPIPREKYFDLLPALPLNNCIILTSTKVCNCILLHVKIKGKMYKSWIVIHFVYMIVLYFQDLLRYMLVDNNLTKRRRSILMFSVLLLRLMDTNISNDVLDRYSFVWKKILVPFLILN